MLRWGPPARGGTMTAPATTHIPGFGGEVIAAGHDRYDDARAVWNGTVDRRPPLIARCRGTADVAAAVPRRGRRRCGSPATGTPRSPCAAGATTWPAPRSATTGS